jgi:hypothetical protein
LILSHVLVYAIPYKNGCGALHAVGTDICMWIY